MPQYLAMAEKVIKDIKQEAGAKIEKDRKSLFTFIILKVRQYSQEKNLKVNQEICTTIFDDEKKIEGIKRIDLTIIPRISNEDEFLLWLAGFIQHITIDESKKDQIPLSIVMKQSKKSSKHTLLDDVNYEYEIYKYFREPSKEKITDE